MKLLRAAFFIEYAASASEGLNLRFIWRHSEEDSVSVSELLSLMFKMKVWLMLFFT